MSEEQEPVAWMVYTLDGTSVCATDNPADFTDQHEAFPLYTAPPDDTALLRQALEVLETLRYNSFISADYEDDLIAAITALRERLGEKT